MSDFDQQNPFQSPLAETGPARVEDSEIEQIRKKHLAHEASIQSMGLLYYIGSVLLALYFTFALVMLVTLRLDDPASLDWRTFFGAAALTSVFGGLSLIQFWIARGLRRLRRPVRIPAILFSIIGLLGFPIGTLISGYFLWLLASKKGAYVFTPEYRDIIDATPYIKYRTSLVSWIFLGLIVLLFIAGIVGFTLFEG